MSEMIERVALAIGSFGYARMGMDWVVYRVNQPPSTEEQRFASEKDAFDCCRRLNARAGIEAMRVPTEAVLDASPYDGDMVTRWNVVAIWHSIIDAALANPNPR